jgi:hypothetical protein
LHDKLPIDLFPSSLFSWLSTMIICSPACPMTCIPNLLCDCLLTCQICQFLLNNMLLYIRYLCRWLIFST